MCCILSCRIWHQNRIIFEMRKLLLSCPLSSARQASADAKLTIIKLTGNTRVAKTCRPCRPVGANFSWPVLILGSFWVICGPFWVIFGPIWTILGHFWAILVLIFCGKKLVGDNFLRFCNSDYYRLLDKRSIVSSVQFPAVYRKCKKSSTKM